MKVVKTVNIAVPELDARIVALGFSEYNDGNLACLATIQFADGEQETSPISVNVPDRADILTGGMFFAKTWSEKEAIYNALIKSGELIRRCYIPCGYAHAAVCNLKDVPPHDCEENMVPYKSDGALGHGWECGLCGRFLQAG
jgi:hypothetical protein